MPYATPELRRSARRRSYAANPSRILNYERKRRKEKPGAFRGVQLKRRYGITLADFDRILAEQNGLCAFCKNKPPVDVDHCHETGKVRGLLCRSCNVGLGQLGDNLEGVKRAIAYLEGIKQ